MHDLQPCSWAFQLCILVIYGELISSSYLKLKPPPTNKPPTLLNPPPPRNGPEINNPPGGINRGFTVIIQIRDKEKRERHQHKESIRKAQAWRALNGMTKIWKSNMSKDLKIRFFIATIESILLYGCESWALSKAQEKLLDGILRGYKVRY